MRQEKCKSWLIILGVFVFVALLATAEQTLNLPLIAPLSIAITILKAIPHLKRKKRI